MPRLGGPPDESFRLAAWMKGNPMFKLSGKSILGCTLAIAAVASFGGSMAKESKTPTALVGAQFQVLYTFCAKTECRDGESPEAAPITDSSGNLYGTTDYGGSKGGGTVFKLAPDGTHTVLHSFCTSKNCADGDEPRASLVMDGAGNLYGTANSGGNSSYRGTVFKISPTGSETTLYSFCSQTNCADGGNPQSSLVMDPAGNLYGTTINGGETNCGTSQAGCGTVFKLAPNGTLTVLHAFQWGSDGAFPYAGLHMD